MRCDCPRRRPLNTAGRQEPTRSTGGPADKMFSHPTPVGERGTVTKTPYHRHKRFPQRAYSRVKYTMYDFSPLRSRAFSLRIRYAHTRTRRMISPPAAHGSVMHCVTGAHGPSHPHSRRHDLARAASHPPMLRPLRPHARALRTMEESCPVRHVAQVKATMLLK